MLIKNFDKLATTSQRKAVLEIVESGLEAIQPEKVVNEQINLTEGRLNIGNQTFDLGNYSRIYLVGFGKGSAGISRLIEKKLDADSKTAERFKAGWVIDVTDSKENSKIKFYSGTHPLPSEQNYQFTRMVVESLHEGINEHDLVIVVVCGGGSAMLTYPKSGDVNQLIQVNRALLVSGANIAETNMVRKKLDLVKGGGLAKFLYPAAVASLIFSDVPGNDLATIASGPTVPDSGTTSEAWNVIQKYGLSKKLEEFGINLEDFGEKEKDEKSFANVHNFLALSNMTALAVMKKKAEELGFEAEIVSDKTQGEAREVGERIISREVLSGIDRKVWLYGGETTVTAKGGGAGGRNQELVMGVLRRLILNGFPDARDVVICSIDSDGWDNSPMAGAIGDAQTLQTCQKNQINIDEYLNNNDSLHFFEKTGDGIETGRLPSNVSDLMVVLN